MRRSVLMLLALGLLLAAAPARAQQEIPVMALSSPDFADGGIISSQYTCNGQSASPPLHIETPPEHTQSFALTMIDTDAPGGAFVHWVVYNLPANTRDIPAAASATVGLGVGAQQGLNSKTELAYTPPCPPAGEHHYIFRLYALDTMLALPTGTSVDKKALDAALLGHVLAQAELAGRYAQHTAP